MTHELLITDLDDTLYSWINYWSPCFRAMVHVLARELKVTEDILFEDFKNVYSKYKTLEFVPVVQDLEICKSLSTNEKDRLVALAHTAFGRTARKHLKVFEGVKETIKSLFYSKVQIVGISNSPVILAMGRLRNLGLSTFFTGLAAFEGHKVPRFETSNKILNDSVRIKANRIENARYKVWSFQETELKPNTVGYLRILQDLQIAPENACVVGDSLYKDIAPAKKIGMMTVLVNFKDSFPIEPKNIETLYRVTHWDKDKIEKVYNDVTIQPDYVITKFSQLKDILHPPFPFEPTQQELFS